MLVRKRVTSVIWAAPIFGQYKLNVDGSPLGNPGESGCGFVRFGIFFFFFLSLSYLLIVLIFCEFLYILLVAFLPHKISFGFCAVAAWFSCVYPTSYGSASPR